MKNQRKSFLRGLWSAEPDYELLDRTVARWKAAEAETALSDSARGRILDEALAQQPAVSSRLRPLASLFVPAHRLGLAAALPALVLALALGLALGPRTARQAAETGTISSVEVQKHGDEVVFTIANGGGEHRVYKSTDIKGLDGGTAFITASGSFRDGLHANGDLVFYRID